MYLQTTSSLQEDLDLCDVMKVGQYLTCSVVDVTTVNKTKKVNLTTKPEIINCSVKKQDIKKNMVSTYGGHFYMNYSVFPLLFDFCNPKNSDDSLQRPGVTRGSTEC